MIFSFLFFSIFLLYLIYESIQINRQTRSIPLRICVAGTRGKTSVVRMLASVLRESGRTVVAKTTGSEALYILPDGEEVAVKRRGIISILEQKKLIRKAVKHEADVLLAEIMSIHPENHYIEAQRIIQPNLVVITNLRPDHVVAMGSTKEEIASVLCNVFTENSTVFCLKGELNRVCEKRVDQMNGTLIAVAEDDQHITASPEFAHFNKGFADNVQLVYSVAKYLNIPDSVTGRGLNKTKFDIGELKIWAYTVPETERIIYCVNGFAANDPETTAEIIRDMKERLPGVSTRIYGLMNLRADRADRTAQWIDALREKRLFGLQHIFVIGSHARIVRRKLSPVTTLKSKTPQKLMEELRLWLEPNAVLFGFGNMKGFGFELVRHWQKIGVDYGV